MGEDERVDSQESEARRRPRLRLQHLQYAIPYSIFVSVLYLLGYWGTFQVDPLEYVGIGDVVKLAIYPLSTVLVIGAAVVGAAHVAIILLGKSLDSVERGLDAFLASRSKLTASVVRIAWLLIAFVLAIFGLSGLDDIVSKPMPNTPNLTVWHFVLVLGLFMGVSLAFKLGSSSVLASIFGSRLMVGFGTFLIVTPIVCAFPAGRSNAYDQLRDGCAPMEVDSSRSSALPAAMNNGTYLGYLGGYVFVREWKTGAIVSTRLSEGQSLVLLPLDTRADGRPRACSRSRRASIEKPAPVTPAD